MYIKKKYIVIILTLVLISTNYISVMSKKNEKIELNIDTNNLVFNLFLDDEIDQYQTEDCGSVACINQAHFYAQGFKPSLNILSSVELLVNRKGIENSNFTVSIRKDLERKDLTKTYIRGYEIKTKEWITFDFQDIFVKPNEIYYIVCHCNEGSICERYIGWYFGNHNPYPDGKSMISNYNGKTWNEINWNDDEHFDTDFCFKTYGYNDPNAHEDLSCQGNLVWNNVSVNSKLTGSISIENIGFCGSCLCWNIIEYPNWGEWEFSCMSGENLTPSDGTKTISITLVSPKEKNAEFIGQIKVVNKNNQDDFDIIQISLTTTKSKQHLTNILFKKLVNRFAFLENLLNQII